MYEYLIGEIVTINPNYLVLNVNNIGYKIFVANPYRFDENQQRTIYIEQIVREQEISLYGFFDADEKNLFNKLLNVSGIGPKSALAILATGDHEGLIAAINNNNVTYLTQFPGIGKKTAQQIILDLQGKLGDIVVSNAPVATPAATSSNLDDALEALVGLGYASKDINRVKTALAHETADTATLISLALKLLVK